MNKLYRFKTSAGYFYLVEYKGKFCSVFGDEILDTQRTLQNAVNELAQGHTWSPAGLTVSVSSLGISSDLSDWERLKK